MSSLAGRAYATPQLRCTASTVSSLRASSPLGHCERADSVSSHFGRDHVNARQKNESDEAYGGRGGGAGLCAYLANTRAPQLTRERLRYGTPRRHPPRALFLSRGQKWSHHSKPFPVTSRALALRARTNLRPPPPTTSLWDMPSMASSSEVSPRAGLGGG